MRWQPAELVEARFETPSARTLVLRVANWPGHLPGQHVDVRLTTPDGYQAVRSYSLAAPAAGDLIEITVQRVPDGEVSGYLVDALPIGAQIEIRGPVGGWFVWNPERGGAAVLIAGGSGIVPLAAMLRARRKAASPSPFRVIYSLRDPADLYYRDELGGIAGDELEAARAAASGGTEAAVRGRGGDTRRATAAPDRGIASVAATARDGDTPGEAILLAFTRNAPPGDPRLPMRLTVEEIAEHALPPSPEVTCYVCGPTGFVEFAAAALVSLGHDPAMIRTERFGPTGK